MHFVELGNTVENLSGSRELSYLNSFSSKCGESRGPSTLSWRSVPRENWCLPSWMCEMQMMCTWPPFTGLGLTSPAFIDGIASPGGNQKGIVRAVCFLLKVLSES